MFIDKKEPASVRNGALSLAAVVAVAVMTGSAALPAHAADTPGMRVVKDPVTGKLRAPTAEEAAAIESTASKPTGSATRGLRTGRINPAPIRYRDGTVEQELTEDSLVYTVAKRNPDGSIGWVCVTGPEAAKQALNDKATVSAGQEHSHER